MNTSIMTCYDQSLVKPNADFGENTISYVFLLTGNQEYIPGSKASGFYSVSTSINPSFLTYSGKTASINTLEKKHIVSSFSPKDGRNVVAQNMVRNLNKIDEISNLTHNWNGYNANPFSNELISKVREIIVGLTIQPEVFPTAADTIQIEYDGKDNSYLEFEISMNKMCNVYSIGPNGSEKEFQIEADSASINEIVGRFFE